MPAPLITLPPRPPELPPAARQVESTPTPNPPDSHGAIDVLLEAVSDLRRIRDRGEYIAAGYHSFREFTVAKFGVNLGCMIDEVL